MVLMVSGGTRPNFVKHKWFRKYFAATRSDFGSLKRGVPVRIAARDLWIVITADIVG